VDRLGIARRRRDVGLHDLEDEQAASVDLTAVHQFALEAREALRDERRVDLRCLDWLKRRIFETGKVFFL
jgi:hypothetical protein